MVFRLANPMALWSIVPLLILIGIMLWKGKLNPLSFSLRRVACAFIGFLACIFALARPQIGHHVAEARSTHSNLILAIDVSQSMMAEDVTPNRLQFSIAFARKLLEQTQGARVALYPFSSDGFLQMPLTNDIRAAGDMLATLDPSMTTEQGSDFSTSLRTLLQLIGRMEEETQKQGEKWTTPQVILFSDGESHDEFDPDILNLFRSKNIQILAVGTGTSVGGPIFTESRFGVKQYLRVAGKPVQSRLEEDTLKLMAERTNGGYFAPSFSEIPRLKRQLAQSFQMGSLTVGFRADQEIFPLLLIVAVFFFTVDLGMGRWQYAIRSLLFLFLCFSGQSVRAAEAEEDNNIKAINVYNHAVERLQSNDLQGAAEAFQESVFLTSDPQVKKKALLNLGNTTLKLQDPAQALQIYQEAYDVSTNNPEFQKEANKKISENIALAQQVQEQQQQQQQQDGKDGEGEEGQKESKDPKGPKTEFQPEYFNERQKQRIFDLIASEEQEVMKRLREKKKGNNPPNANGKPW